LLLPAPQESCALRGRLLVICECDEPSASEHDAIPIGTNTISDSSPPGTLHRITIGPNQVCASFENRTTIIPGGSFGSGQMANPDPALGNVLVESAGAIPRHGGRIEP
jgi:hypothetical protein